MAGKRVHTVRSGRPTLRQRRKAPVKNVPEGHRPDAVEIGRRRDDDAAVRKVRDRKPANDDFDDPDFD
ncbi:hypothetical protein SAMN03159496_06161 [Rhizobium sp. NFR07]|uniref:hypothetical protein n=1 Tax=Rhizobium sp. NFR07 TaxID=1566262 RepID=UPI0008EF0452|nr:hypothetical protein [Rhizobium sp. NFR07]SFB63057.1 hypothetical protein SAMN03159496_06161 [Rhizobium sp. NFR07]